MSPARGHRRLRAARRGTARPAGVTLLFVAPSAPPLSPAPPQPMRRARRCHLGSRAGKEGGAAPAARSAHREPLGAEPRARRLACPRAAVPARPPRRPAKLRPRGGPLRAAPGLSSAGHRRGGSPGGLPRARPAVAAPRRETRAAAASIINRGSGVRRLPPRETVPGAAGASLPAPRARWTRRRFPVTAMPGGGAGGGAAVPPLPVLQ